MKLTDFLKNPTVFQTNTPQTGVITEGGRDVVTTPIIYVADNMPSFEDERNLQLAWGDGKNRVHGYRSHDPVEIVLYSTKVSRSPGVVNLSSTNTVEIQADTYRMERSWRPSNVAFYFTYKAAEIREQMYLKHIVLPAKTPAMTGASTLRQGIPQNRTIERRTTYTEVTLTGDNCSTDISSTELAAYEAELHAELTKLYTSTCPKKFNIIQNGNTVPINHRVYSDSTQKVERTLTKTTQNYTIIVSGTNKLSSAPVLTLNAMQYSNTTTGRRGVTYTYYAAATLHGLACNIKDTSIALGTRATETADIAVLRPATTGTKKRQTRGQWRGPYYGLRHCRMNKRNLFELHMNYGLQGAEAAPTGYAERVSKHQLPISVTGFLEEIERPVIDIKPIILGHLELLRMGPSPTGVPYAITLADLLVPSMTEAIISLDSTSLVGVTEEYMGGDLCRGDCAIEDEVSASLEAGLYLVRRIPMCSKGQDPGRTEYNEGFGAICNERISLMTLLSQLTLQVDELRATSVALGGVDPSAFNYGMMSSMDRL